MAKYVWLAIYNRKFCICCQVRLKLVANQQKEKLLELRETLVSLVIKWGKSRWVTISNFSSTSFICLHFEFGSAYMLCAVWKLKSGVRCKTTFGKKSRKNREKENYVKDYSYTSKHCTSKFTDNLFPGLPYWCAFHFSLLSDIFLEYNLLLGNIIGFSIK